LVSSGIKKSRNPGPNLTASAMSFVLSGPRNGRTWTCSVMGGRLSKHVRSRKGQEPQGDCLLEELGWIIPNFAHDQRSMRCLIVMTITGYMLSEMAAAYTHVLKILDDALNITVSPKHFNHSNVALDCVQSLILPPGVEGI
jgi:hypothetical protein